MLDASSSGGLERKLCTLSFSVILIAWFLYKMTAMLLFFAVNLMRRLGMMMVVVLLKKIIVVVFLANFTYMHILRLAVVCTSVLLR